MFGARAGKQRCRRRAHGEQAALDRTRLGTCARSAARRSTKIAANPAGLIVDLQAVMTDNVGPFRTAAKLNAALAEIDRIAGAIAGDPMSSGEPSDSVLVDWLDLRNMLLVARGVALPALARTESRGAHQREDYPGLDAVGSSIRSIDLRDGKIALSSRQPRCRHGNGERPGMNATLLIQARRRRRAAQGRALRRAVRCTARPCSTVCAMSAAIRTRRSLFASPASMPMPARNA